jgi:hypothetical protein
MKHFFPRCCAVAVLTGWGGIVNAQQQAVSHPLRAAVSMPVFALMATGTSTRTITAAEASANVSAAFIEAYSRSVTFRSAHYPMDSIRSAVERSGAQWLSRVQAAPIVGIQLDPSGKVGVAADREAYAQRQIATRLATSGLTLEDQAFALRTAVEAFSDMYAPERLPTAERYLVQLDALGDKATLWQFEARRTLLWTYYLLGRSADVVRIGTSAIAVLGRVPFADRYLPMFAQITDQVYSPVIEALTSQPDARAAIERVNTMLRATTIPSPALVAADRNYEYLGQLYQRKAQELIEGNAKLGTKAAPLIAHHWINRPSPDSAMLAVDDGKIRLIEVAHTGCLPCVHELYGIQRILARHPGIEPVLLTWTFGSWGNRLVEPHEEVAHLTEYFVTNTKVTFPVGIWAGKKRPNEDGGMIPDESPNLKDYPIFGKPMLWVVDGRGIIRRVFTGYDRDIEGQIARTVDFLVREAAGTATTARPPVMTSLSAASTATARL